MKHFDWRAGVLFLLALALVGAGIWNVRLTCSYADPYSRIPAQDEAIYVHAVRSMVERGDWLTPTVFGRPFLIKPPLLFVLTALSVKILGLSLVSVRLPCLIAGAIGCLAMYRWPRGSSRPWAGFFAAALLVSNANWRTFARVCQTDVLVAALIACALWVLARHPSFESRWRSTVPFGVLAGLALVAKGLYGFLAILVLAMWWAAHWVLSLSGKSPSLRSISEAVGVSFLIAAPWHIYQAVRIPQWFWADYVQLSLLTWGAAPPVNTAESVFAHYGARLFFGDPMLCLLAVIALPWFWSALRRRDAQAWLLLCWLSVVTVAVLAFRFRSAHYLLGLIPALCLLAAHYGPWSTPARRWTLAGALAAAFLVKSLAPGFHPWTLPFSEPRPAAAAGYLRAYYELHRANPLFVIEGDDQFYSATLGLRRVRYPLLDPSNRIPELGRHYAETGIIMSIADFIGPESGRAAYHRKLKEWNISDEPMGTTLTARSEEDFARLVAHEPDADFYLPAGLGRKLAQRFDATHRLWEPPPDGVFLLAKRSSRRTGPELPARW